MIKSNEWTKEQQWFFLFGYCYRKAQEDNPKASTDEINRIANIYMQVSQHKL